MKANDKLDQSRDAALSTEQEWSNARYAAAAVTRESVVAQTVAAELALLDHNATAQEIDAAAWAAIARARTSIARQARAEADDAFEAHKAAVEKYNAQVAEHRKSEDQ